MVLIRVPSGRVKINSVNYLNTIKGSGKYSSSILFLNSSGVKCAGRIGYLNQGIRLNPFPAYWYFQNLGRCYILKGQYEKALTEYKKALHRSPDNPSNHLSLALIYALLDQQEEAEAAAKKVLEIMPRFSVERASKGWPYKNKADLKLIVDALRKAGFPE